MGTLPVVAQEEKILDFPIFWAKGKPYTKFMPVNENSEHGAWSCGQVAHSMIIRYWSLQQKLHTQGTHFYYRKVNNEMLFADFSEPFEWNEMLNSLYGFDITDSSVDPVADLAYRFCIATRTDWWSDDLGDWYRGYSYKEGLLRYFGFDLTDYRRGNILEWVNDNSWDALYSRINQDIDAGQPCELVLTGSGGAVHEVVITGYRLIDDHYEYAIHFGGDNYNPDIMYKLDQPIKGWDIPENFMITWGIKPYPEESQPPTYNTILQATGELNWFNKGAITWNGSEYAALLPAGTDENREIIFQRVSDDGLPVNAAVSLHSNSLPDPRPAIKCVGDSYAVTWRDSVSEQKVLRFNYISSIGKRLLSKDIIIGNEASLPSLVWDGTHCALAWRNGSRVYFCRIDNVGNIVGEILDLGRRENPSLCWTGNEYGLSWVDPNQRNIHAVRISSDGYLLGAVNSLHLSDCIKVLESTLAHGDNAYGIAFLKVMEDGRYVVNFCMLNSSGQFVEDSVVVAKAHII